MKYLLMITQQPPYHSRDSPHSHNILWCENHSAPSGVTINIIGAGNNTIRERPPQAPPKRGMGLSNTTESWKIIVWKELEEKLSSLVV
ncbi:hypothetical protein [Prevotella histicola]|jgi:hypothetical protein|uniref:hypothetical protein n=1 Tax=Prevotella histicola TaxID=470565 RepID=UPI0036096EC5